jgi:serine/threonine protein kinase
MIGSLEGTALGGRYQLEGLLGQGGMAQVYRGTDTVLGRTVAIKVLGPQYTRDEAFVTRFRREAQAAARLNHPGVVSVYDTGSDQGVHYIVMEYVAGRTLAEILHQEGRLLPERAAEVAAQVAGALSFAHAAHLVHRDVKPANIMLTPGGEVKVMDFGIARALSTDSLTQTATVLGTASYLSPEQAQGAAVDPRSDVYSLGVVLYEMLTGQAPFAGDSPVAVAYKHVREDPVLPTALVPEVGGDLEAVVMKAMAKNPANRYASAEEMKEDLERVLHGEPVAATPVLAPEQSTQVLTRPVRDTAVLPVPAVDDERRRRRRIAAGILIGILVLGALVAGLILLATSLIGSTPTVKVPDVRNRNVEAAKIVLQQARLKFKVTEKPSSRPADTVIDQSPDPGTEVKEGTTVELTVSTGPRQVTVPNLAGQSPKQAAIALQQLKLELGQAVGTVASATIPPGKIVRTLPKAGEMVSVGTSVDYVTSSGKPTAVIPTDVICQSVADATSELETAGFHVESGGQADTSNPDCPELDKVATTDPPPGSEVPKGSTLTLFTSFPPPSPTGPTGPTGPSGPSGSPSPSPS